MKGTVPARSLASLFHSPLNCPGVGQLTEEAHEILCPCIQLSRLGSSLSQCTACSCHVTEWFSFFCFEISVYIQTSTCAQICTSVCVYAGLIVTPNFSALLVYISFVRPTVSQDLRGAGQGTKFIFACFVCEPERAADQIDSCTGRE